MADKKEMKRNYPCQFCGKMIANPRARLVHEKFCPKNPNKLSLAPETASPDKVYAPPPVVNSEKKKESKTMAADVKKIKGKCTKCGHEEEVEVSDEDIVRLSGPAKPVVATIDGEAIKKAVADALPPDLGTFCSMFPELCGKVEEMYQSQTNFHPKPSAELAEHFMDCPECREALEKEFLPKLSSLRQKKETKPEAVITGPSAPAVSTVDQPPATPATPAPSTPVEEEKDQLAAALEEIFK